MSLTVLIFWTTYAAGVISALVSPLMGVLLYVLVYHLNPEEQWWGETVQSSGIRTSMTIAVAIVIGLIWRRPRFLAGGQFRFPAPLMLLFTLLAVTSLGWGYDMTPRSEFQIEKLIKVMIFLMILIRCVREPAHYHLLILSWLVGVLYISYQAWGNVGVTIGGRLAFGLGGPDFYDSSDLAAHLVATLPLIAAFFFMSRSMLGRGFALITGALTVNTIIMTRTRGAMLGCVVMVAILILSLPRGYRLRGWIAMAVAGMLAAQLVDPGWWDRMQTISSNPNDASSTARFLYWNAALEMAAEHPLGIGLGNFHTIVREYLPQLKIVRSAHNTYLEVLAEMGFAGALLLGLIIVGVLMIVSRLRREANRYNSDIAIHPFRVASRFHLGWHATALRASIIGYLVCAAFVSRVCGEDFWILLTMVLCLNNVNSHMRMLKSASRFTPDQTPVTSPTPGGRLRCESP